MLSSTHLLHVDEHEREREEYHAGHGHPHKRGVYTVLRHVGDDDLRGGKKRGHAIVRRQTLLNALVHAGLALLKRNRKASLHATAAHLLYASLEVEPHGCDAEDREKKANNHNGIAEHEHKVIGTLLLHL